MSGDGVSLPTTITQLGQLAKAQARSQQAATQTPGSLPAEDKEHLQPVRKVNQTEPKGKRTLQRRQQGGGRQPDADTGRPADEDRQEDDPVQRLDHDDDDPDSEPEPDDRALSTPGLGGLIDTKA